MQFELDSDELKPAIDKSSDSGLSQGQSSEDIERELQEKLASLGINLAGGAAVQPTSRATQGLPTAIEEKRTSMLDIGELRSALRQQIGIAEIKIEVEKILRGLLGQGPDRQGQTQELELRASALMLPYCKEYIPDFPKELRPSEFALDLNLEDIIDFHSDLSGLSAGEIDETIEQYAVQIIQILLSHPLIPQKAAKRIGVDLKTTALKDERGTAMYSTTDAQFLQVLFNEQRLLERGGEVGLLAILISGKKWNKIDSDSLFNTAVHYTLEAMAKIRGIPSIVLRGQGQDHPVAYILSEYIAHNLDQSLEGLIGFIEGFMQVAHQAVSAPAQQFIPTLYNFYLPKLKMIFHDNLHESFDRFIEIFRREFQQSKQTPRNRIFLLKRVGDVCELSFYCYEAIRAFESASGEVYAKEKLDEGTKHFAFRNNIPLDETGDFLTKKNTLSELLAFTLKQRFAQRQGDGSSLYFISKLMNDLLFFIDNLRRAFDHAYARGRATSSADYAGWEELVSDCTQSYARLFFGRTLNDIERYYFENLYKRLIEMHLSFFDLQSPSLFQSNEIKLEKFAKVKSPQENLKEHFLKFFMALHQTLMNFDSGKAQVPAAAASSNNLEPSLAITPAKTRNTAALTMEAVKARAFLSQSDLPLSDYTLEALSSAINPDVKDKVTLNQALRSTLDLAGKARTSEEIRSMNLFLKNLRQRISLLYALSDQEKDQWTASIAASIKELEQNDPIAFSSYGMVLNSIEDWDISNERILEEWRNPESSILRMQQLFFILLLTRPRDEAEGLAEEFRRWLAESDLPAESARKKVFERRVEMLDELLGGSRVKLFLLIAVLQSMRYVQLSAETTIWRQPQAYILEDLLAVETPIKKLREINTVLLTKSPEEVCELVEKFRSVLSDRFQQSSSGYSYYTDEEKLIMEKRLRRFELLGKRPAWKAKLNSFIFSTIKLFLGPIKRIQVSEQK